MMTEISGLVNWMRFAMSCDLVRKAKLWVRKCVLLSWSRAMQVMSSIAEMMMGNVIPACTEPIAVRWDRIWWYLGVKLNLFRSLMPVLYAYWLRGMVKLQEKNGRARGMHRNARPAPVFGVMKWDSVPRISIRVMQVLMAACLRYHDGLILSMA